MPPVLRDLITHRGPVGGSEHAAREDEARGAAAREGDGRGEPEDQTVLRPEYSPPVTSTIGLPIVIPIGLFTWPKFLLALSILEPKNEPLFSPFVPVLLFSSLHVCLVSTIHPLSCFSPQSLISSYPPSVFIVQNKTRFC